MSTTKIEVEKPFFHFYNAFAKRVYSFIPFTYYWYLQRVVGAEGKTLIDFGCGWGDPVAVLQNRKKRYAVGVDIYQKYLDVVQSRNIYNKLIKSDISKYRVKKKYDIVMCSHVLEHLPKKKVLPMINYFDSISKQLIVIALPVGRLDQDTYDGNKYQRHLSEWSPAEFREMGFKVLGFSPRVLYGQKNAIKEYKVFGFILFVVAYLLEPIFVHMPEKCVYMLAYKRK